MRKTFLSLLVVTFMLAATCGGQVLAQDIVLPEDRDFVVDSDRLEVGDDNTAGTVKLSDGSNNFLTLVIGAIAANLQIAFPQAMPTADRALQMSSTGNITTTPNVYQQLFTGTTTVSHLGSVGAETAMAITGDGALTFGANTLTAGRHCRIEGGGLITTDADGSETLRFKVKLGSGLTMLDTGVIGLSVAQLNAPYWFVVEFDTRSVGASGVIAYRGNFFYKRTGDTVGIVVPICGTGTVDTTGANLASLYCDWDNGDASDVVDIEGMSLQWVDYSE